MFVLLCFECSFVRIVLLCLLFNNDPNIICGEQAINQTIPPHMIILIIEFFLNRSISIIMDCCYYGFTGHLVSIIICLRLLMFLSFLPNRFYIYSYSFYFYFLIMPRKQGLKHVNCIFCIRVSPSPQLKGMSRV